MEKEVPSLHNQATGGRHVVQANAIHGGVHFHAAPDAEQHHDLPFIVSCETSCDKSVVVQSDLPRHTPLSGRQEVEILIEARNAQAVTLRALRPVILARRSPRPAFLFNWDPVDGATFVPRYFSLELGPQSVSLASEEVSFPFKVTASDPEMFRLSPKVTEHEVDWRLELDWTCAGRIGTVVINNKGRPFQLYPHDQPLTEATTRRELPGEGFRSTQFRNHGAAVLWNVAVRTQVLDYWHEVYNERVNLDATFRRDLGTAANDLERLLHQHAADELTEEEVDEEAGQIIHRLHGGDPQRRKLLDNGEFLNETSKLLRGGAHDMRVLLVRGHRSVWDGRIPVVWNSQRG